jgi:hypothetical protein
MTDNNYDIMSKDTLVATWKDNTLTVVNDTLIPLYLHRVHNADMWLETRAIDSHRANSRLLKKALHLEEKNDISTVMYVNASTITDTYWIKPAGSGLTYTDVRFISNSFSTLALKGTYTSFNRAANSKNSRTPELTNIGSFEKGWKRRDGKWWLYKAANLKEQFSELFTYELGITLGMNMAYYERGDGHIKTLDFTNGASVNFEPASAFMGENENYPDTVKALHDLCPSAIPDYIKMIFLDTVIANPDRHTGNFGLLRDTDTGKIMGLAPVFDHNMALISRGYPNKPKKNDMLISLFNDLLRKYPKFRQHIPSFNRQTVGEIIDKLNIRVRKQDVIDLVMSRYELIE